MKSMANKLPEEFKKDYATFLDLVFYPNQPVDLLDDFVYDEVMGYGTTLDEKLFGVDALKELAILQRSQADAIKFKHKVSPVYSKINENGSNIIVVDEIKMIMLVDGNEVSFDVRMTTIWELFGKSWKLVHWHGSKPEYDSGGTDTWHIDEWKQKNAELQKQVEEKTADLAQKNRELEIETSLERVRTAAMSMQKAEDLLDVCQIISEQLEVLEVKNIRNVQLAIINEYSKTYSNYQFFAAYKKAVYEETNYLNNPASTELAFEMKKSAHSFFVGSINGKEFKEFKDWRKQFKQFPDPILDDLNEVFYYFYSIGNGGLGLTTYQPISDEELDIFKRFHTVFKLAYSRFIDLQKAEEQAHEAEIQLALERVRARTMAMQKSEELLETVSLISRQLKDLGEEIDQITIGVFKEDKNLIDIYGTIKGNLVQTLDASIEQSAMMSRIHKAWEAGKKSLIIELSGEELIKYNKWRNEFLNKDIYPIDNPNEIWFVNAAMFSKGMLGFSSSKQVSREANELLERFAAVFNLTYTRFLDLKRAENQAIEAQIETGLERARAQSMMMQHSDELIKTCQVFHEQVQLLGVDSEFSYLWLPEEHKNEHVFWTTWQDSSSEYQNRLVSYPLDKSDPVIAECYVAWESESPVHVNRVKPDNVASYFKDWTELLDDIEKFKPKNYPDGLYYVDAYMKYGCFGIMTKKLLSEDEKQILHRFSNEFERAYTRFLDLKEAEARAKEIQLELSLERIRAQVTMMQESSDLFDIVVNMRKEFLNLGHEADYFWYMRYTQNTYEKAMTSGDGTKIGMVMRLPRHIHGDIKLVADWEKSNESTLIFPMDTETAVDYVDKMISLGDFQQLDPNAPTLDDIRSLGGLTFIMARTQYGEIGFSLPGEVQNPPEESIETLDRFASVFDLAYRRFEDLKNAEARTKEAMKQATLDRVRAQVASMRKPDDLKQITPLIWNELKTLEVPFFRCGIFIIDETKEQVDVYLTTPDGRALASFNLAFHANTITDKTVEHWRKRKIYQQHWNKDAFISWTKELIDKGQIKTPAKYQGDADPPESLYLHFIPFEQGMIYVGNSEQLSDENMESVRSLAGALSYAYARYEDFIILEEAKTKVEKALGELKATQSQLIHAEKMASLGELTAGVAHEIQNPLNFVNNFSEVNKELIEELKEELEAGNIEDVKEIANDISSNEEKIKFHGSRADTIVRNMLQHSRNSGDEKVKTNINSIADEYMRLSFHGMRAKDKSFQSDFDIELAKDLPDINVVPQDFGRVLLNLINNAFYAVNKRRQADNLEYKPLVKIKTEKIKDIAEIRITDNGTGIPKKNLEKIFQPFFTTKPTGEGTGLGLSLSYDIITKGHGGEMLVESTEGKGTTFIIKLNI